MSIIRRGAEGLLRVLNSGNLDTLYSGLGILKNGAISGFQFLTLNVRTIAFLDPKGFAKDKTVRIPALVTQVVDRNQQCELLPPHSFGRNMRIEKGELIVDTGGKEKVSFPLSPLKGADGERIITMDGKKLYAINTNQERAALDALWLSPPSQYQNKRMVIACDSRGNIMPTIRGVDNDRRVMKAVYNAEVSPEMRRVVNNRTGKTIWSATVLVALPFNIMAGMLNVAWLVPHALLNGAKKLLASVANMCENKVQHLAISRSRGTAIGGMFTSPWPFIVVGTAMRLFERVASLGSAVVGCARAVSVNSLMLVPVVTNAGINSCPAQWGVAKQCVYDTGREVRNEIGQYASEVVDSLRFYMLNVTRAIKSRPVVRAEEAKDSNLKGIKAEVAKGITSVERSSVVTIDRVNVQEQAINHSKSGAATVSYGTRGQVSYGLKVSGGAAKEAEQGLYATVNKTRGRAEKPVRSPVGIKAGVARDLSPIGRSPVVTINSVDGQRPGRSRNGRADPAGIRATVARDLSPAGRSPVVAVSCADVPSLEEAASSLTNSGVAYGTAAEGQQQSHALRINDSAAKDTAQGRGVR
ncbi:hypothetical protein [Anaplasma bovis]|uniref:hypothetical protein n=1 Tax=Anaplasma bovis TaxID=186733 RepID=UPI002FEF1820